MKQPVLSPFIFLLILLLACNGQNPPTAEKQDAVKSKAMGCNQLDGRQYNIALSTGNKVESNEILSFKDKTVESSECLQYGFMATPYKCSEALDGSLAIETAMLSEKEGRMDWKFTTTETSVRGTMLWTKAGQADIAYTFEGTAK